MTLLDVVKNILGDKVNEEITTGSSNEQTPNVPPANNEQNTSVPDSLPPSPSSDDKIKELEETVEKLKKDNLALLTRTPSTGGEEKTVEQNIMDICMPKFNKEG